ncbi:hypothetical protein HK102_000924 [Quaeritorhiza haematococci]|nr:hypothetical protein HK102_000924 [Quaeritorhiza haematococci]
MDTLLERLSTDPTLCIKDVEAVKKKLQAIVADGTSHVHIISDFDMTLTRYWDNGQRSVSSHGILMRSQKVSANYKQLTQQLYDKYYPIEVSHTVPHEEKVQAMIQWWTKAHEITMEAKISKQDIMEMVKEVPVCFRPQIEEFVKICRDRNIPLLIFSAGLADVIEQVLTQAKLGPSPNMHVVSNKMTFDSNGVCNGFEDPLIHVFNKNEASLSSTDYFPLIQNRRNVILMGDSIGDLRMSEGLSHDTQLSIGFLNHDKERLLSQYLDAFDIVITDDAPLDFVCGLLEAVRG